MTVRDGRSELDVLLDEQNRDTRGLDLADDLPDPLHDDRGQALAGLVQQQISRTHPQDACDCQHLLLAT